MIKIDSVNAVNIQKDIFAHSIHHGYLHINPFRPPWMSDKIFIDLFRIEESL